TLPRRETLMRTGPFSLTVASLTLAACVALSGCSSPPNTDATATSEEAIRSDVARHGGSSVSKTVALINSLQTGDPSAAIRFVDDKTYIQHDLDVPDGKAALLAFIPYSARAGNTAHVARAFSDGDYVVAHTDYNLFGPKIGFDVVRFDHGKIV